MMDIIDSIMIDDGLRNQEVNGVLYQARDNLLKIYGKIDSNDAPTFDPDAVKPIPKYSDYGDLGSVLPMPNME